MMSVPNGRDWWTSCGNQGAPPLAATPQTESRPTEGRQVGALAKALGTPLLPWQQYVADVAGERLPNGEYAYQIVVVSVPRQSGKTTLIRSVGCHRAAILGRDAFYTAQTGKDARARFNDLVKAIRVSPLKRMVEVRRAAGSERVRFHGGADFQLFAPTPESLHGYTPPTVFLDESFAHTDEEGELLMGAIGPAQLTITDRQVWIVSTAGTAESGFLKRWLDKARQGMPRVAVFLWAADDEMDVYDPADVERFHPGVGFVLNGRQLKAADVVAQAEVSGSRAEYERAYGNRWTITASNIIPREVWRDLAAEVAAPELGQGVLSYDVAHDQLSATVSLTWTAPDGRPHSKVVQAGPGVTWVAPAVLELRETLRPAAVAALPGGHTADITDDLIRSGVPVVVPLAADAAAATSRVLNLVRSGGLTHDGTQLLADAAAGIALRTTNDGVTVSRSRSAGDVSAFVCLVAGVWVLGHAPAPDHPAVVSFSGAT
jgi:hypothetical protein